MRKLMTACVLFLAGCNAGVVEHCTTVCGTWLPEPQVTCDELSVLQVAAANQLDPVLDSNLCDQMDTWIIHLERTVPDTLHYPLGTWPNYRGKPVNGETPWVAGLTWCSDRGVDIAYWPGEWTWSAFAHEMAHVAECKMKTDDELGHFRSDRDTEDRINLAVWRANMEVRPNKDITQQEAWTRAQYRATNEDRP